jgi:hypothetical protein
MITAHNALSMRRRGSSSSGTTTPGAAWDPDLDVPRPAWTPAWGGGRCAPRRCGNIDMLHSDATGVRSERDASTVRLYEPATDT